MATLSTTASTIKVLDKIAQFKDNKSIPIKETCVNCLLSMREEPKIRDKDFAKLAESFSFFLFDSSQ
jgi:Zn ribbon nucleic-acid-binding protein